MTDTAAAYGVAAGRREGYPGCWCEPESATPRKLGALGLKRRAGRQLPRHRAQHHHAAVRLRPDRPVRHARPRQRPRSPASGLVGRRGAAVDGLGRGRRAIGSPTPSRDPPGRSRRRSRPLVSRRLAAHRPPSEQTVAGGLFELRKDDITGWWVAVVVDREFDRARFALPARPIGNDRHALPELRPRCRRDRVWVRMLKPQAFTVAGSEREAATVARRSGTGTTAARDATRSSACSATSGRWQTIVAPRGHHETLAESRRRSSFEMLARARDAIDGARGRSQTRVPPGRPELGRAGGRLTDHLCLDFYDLPQIPHRIGEELGGAARYRHPRGRVPVLPPRPRRGRQPGAARLRGRGERLLRAIRVALAVRAVGRAAPPRGRLRHAPRTRSWSARPRRCCRASCGCCRRLGGPAYNLVLHTAPLRQRVDETYHWHWEIHPAAARDRRARARHGPAGQPGQPRGGRRRAAGHRRSADARRVAAAGARGTNSRDREAADANVGKPQWDPIAAAGVTGRCAGPSQPRQSCAVNTIGTSDTRPDPRSAPWSGAT